MKEELQEVRIVKVEDIEMIPEIDMVEEEDMVAIDQDLVIEVEIDVKRSIRRKTKNTARKKRKEDIEIALRNQKRICIDQEVETERESLERKGKQENLKAQVWKVVN